MKIGAVFPQIEMAPDPGAIRHYAQAVEEMGYDHILAFDHVVGGNARSHALKGIYTHEDGFHEPFVLYGFMAAVTRRIEFVTGIIILPQRQTALVAKQAAALDVLSGGRFRLGIGVGWNDVEYEALGMSFADRGARSEEQIALLRALWTNELVTFEGRWHRVTDAGLNPLPVQRPIPIWIGGHADATLRRVARLGDGWIPLFPPDEKGAARMDRLRGYIREAGRAETDVGIESWINVGGYDDGFGATYPDADSWRGWTSAWKALGASHISVNTMKCGYETVDQHLETLARFKEVVADL